MILRNPGTHVLAPIAKRMVTQMQCETCGHSPAYSVKHIPSFSGWIELVETQTLCGNCVVKLRNETEQAMSEHRRREVETDGRHCGTG